MTFHALRDTAATLMLQGGVPAHVVSRILGHASEAITLSVYAHVRDGGAGRRGGPGDLRVARAPAPCTHRVDYVPHR